MTVDVIIVNYHSGDLLLRCLRALQNQTARHTVQIIDNSAGDGTARRVHETFPDVRILPLRRNVGFARAVNIAAGRSKADIIVTLNPDTIPEPEFIEQIAAPFTGISGLASVAGTLVFETQPDVIASAGINVHKNGVAIDARLGEKLSGGGVTPVFGASAGAAAYHRQRFLETGGLAEPFFMYLEDVDLAWRLRLRGYESVVAPGAVAQHSYSASAGEGSAFKRRLLARNRIWTLARCLPSELLARDGLRIAAFDAAATAFGVATLDRATVAGRAEAMARIIPRLIERDAIQRTARVGADELDRWILPPISPFRLRSLREMTAHLAHSRDTP